MHPFVERLDNLMEQYNDKLEQQKMSVFSHKLEVFRLNPERDFIFSQYFDSLFSRFPFKKDDYSYKRNQLFDLLFPSFPVKSDSAYCAFIIEEMYKFIDELDFKFIFGSALLKNTILPKNRRLTSIFEPEPAIEYMYLDDAELTRLIQKVKNVVKPMFAIDLFSRANLAGGRKYKMDFFHNLFDLLETEHSKIPLSFKFRHFLRDQRNIELEEADIKRKDLGTLYEDHHFTFLSDLSFYPDPEEIFKYINILNKESLALFEIRFFDQMMGCIENIHLECERGERSLESVEVELKKIKNLTKKINDMKK